jgi:hypothetical protein
MYDTEKAVWASDALHEFPSSVVIDSIVIVTFLIKSTWPICPPSSVLEFSSEIRSCSEACELSSPIAQRRRRQPLLHPVSLGIEEVLLQLEHALPLRVDDAHMGSCD